MDNKYTKLKYLILCIIPVLFIISCKNEQHIADSNPIYYPSNMLDYVATPSSPEDRSFLAFSDMGAWFAYSFPKESAYNGGFSGPFLMNQENGVWSSKALSQLELINPVTNQSLNWSDFEVRQISYNSHLEQIFEGEFLSISQKLFYTSAHSVLITTQITNLSEKPISLQSNWRGTSFLKDLIISKQGNSVSLTSSKSTAKGKIVTFGETVITAETTDSSYLISLENFELNRGESKKLIIGHLFTFPEYSMKDELLNLEEVSQNPEEFLQLKIDYKKSQLEKLYNVLDTNWKDSVYKNLVAKAELTLQNNWRVAAGELKHSGLFPSYHYIWFHGFWAWDSWKHAVILSYYQPHLAKEQIRAMYDFQTEDGFIPDCIFRDTTIERHNYRNSKPPLSAWATWKVYEQSMDLNFLEELYPKILDQHKWWYLNRDHDRDGICEYGSTDGSLVAAKWESGMDNAVRFDHSKIMKNSNGAYSLDQESVDLNAYLYAEKKYLLEMALVLNKQGNADTLEKQAEKLKKAIQAQFFDAETGWFYDTSLDGKTFIRAMGCEGWIPLWAEVATKEQAFAVKKNMMNPNYFNTYVPFQTLSASHPDFKPDGGYWRGPNWLDQSYFGVRGLHKYGYHEDAYNATYKLIHNADGVLGKGKSIRENYQPINGKGLESENFSWSAAHYLLLLINE